MTTKIIIPSSGIIDLKEDIPLSFNYNIADIRKPDKKHGNYSKTITIPGSANNDKMFMHIFEIGIDRQFNPNKKVKVMVMAAETLVFRGYLRLLKINKLRDKLEYEVTITGKLSNIFTDLKDKKLNDLNWDDLDHTYNKANQKASWTAAVGSKYIYGFIDYGYSINDLDYNINHFFPGIYLKEYIDRIFKEAGYQYTSTFFTSDFFKRLFIPFTGDRLLYTAAEINTRLFKASRKTTIQTNTVTALVSSSPNIFTIIFNDDSTAPNTDVSNQYNTTSGALTILSTGHYNIRAEIYSRIIISISTPNSPVEYSPRGNFEIYNQTQGLVLASSPIKDYENPDPATWYCIPLSSQPAAGTTNSFVLQASQVLLNKDDIIIVRHKVWKNKLVTCSGGPDNNTYTLETLLDSSFDNTVIPNITDGDSITMKNLISSNIKQSTFLSAIMQMFNLYTETDPNNDTVLLIEPRNDFYNQTVIDWSDLLDESQDLVIEPMGALDNKSYVFTYKKDDDFLNKLHFEGYGYVYGRKRLEVDNDFLKNEMVIESIFSATPQSSAQYGKDFPKIINVDKDGNIVRKKNNLRLIYYSGLVTVASWETWKFYSGNSFTTETQYPHCGHIDNSLLPTIDLSFGVPSEVYYEIKWNAKYTNNNLYNVYWRQEIEEITDKNSSIVTGWFRLRAADIFALDFRKLYVFKNQQFRLNKVIDYNPTAEGLTKCEFIKVKLAKPFVATNVNLLGSSDVLFEAADSASLTPIIRFTDTPGGNTREPKGRNLVIGTNNKVSDRAWGILVTGSDNLVGDDCQNITILESSGVIVSGGLQNVDVRNSSGVIVNESNTTIQGQPMIFGRPSEFAAEGFDSKADGSAFMDIRSKSKGFLVPRMTLSQKGAIVSPASGLLVYQTDVPIGFQYYQGGGVTWRQMVNTTDLDAYALLAGRSGGQTLIGGTGVNDPLKFRSTSGVGTSGADIIFQVGNNGATEAMRIFNNADVSIGTTSDNARLSVVGDYTAAGLKIFEATRTGVSSTLAYFRVSNATNQAGQFLPFFDLQSNYLSTGNAIGGYFVGRPVEDNSSSDVALRFDGRTPANTALTTAAIAEFSTANNIKVRFMSSGRVGIGVIPTAMLHLPAGTVTANTAPLKFNSGTNLTTAEAGAMEYNGTNLFFTRVGAAREGIITQSAVNVVSPTSPNRTITVNIDGSTYYLAAKTTND